MKETKIEKIFVFEKEKKDLELVEKVNEVIEEINNLKSKLQEEKEK